MTAGHQKPLLKPFLFLLAASLFFLVLYVLRASCGTNGGLTSTATDSPSLRIRPGFRTYEVYIERQLNKTLNPRLREVWATRDWERKVRVFARFFSELQAEGLLSNASRALCVGARMGQEVAALRQVGVGDSLGMDLVPAPPLVVRGDFHAQPFAAGAFDFEFSNVFDHALYPERFASEIERTLRPGGVCVLHVALKRKGDKYSANDLYRVDGVVSLFKESDLVRVRDVDGFGLDTEVVLRKKKNNNKKNEDNTGPEKRRRISS